MTTTKLNPDDAQITIGAKKTAPDHPAWVEFARAMGPMMLPAGTSSGSMLGLMGMACHFQSCGAAQQPFL